MRNTLTTLVFFLAICDGRPIPPNGWRYPAESEVDGSYRNGDPKKYVESSDDYNFDKTEDSVFILKNSENSIEGLWVYLSDKKGELSWILLDKLESGDGSIIMGVSSLKPGKYKYICFDEADTCDYGPIEDRPTIEIKGPSIDYFMFESAGSIFFYDNQKMRFRRIWISD